MLLTQLYARVGTLQQCCSPSYAQGLAMYNNAAHPGIRQGWHFTSNAAHPTISEGWHFKTMLLTSYK